MDNALCNDDGSTVFLRIKIAGPGSNSALPKGCPDLRKATLVVGLNAIQPNKKTVKTATKMKATRQHVSHCLVIGMTIMSFTFITLPLYLIHSANEGNSSGGSGSGIRFLYHPFLATGEQPLVTPSLTR